MAPYRQFTISSSSTFRHAKLLWEDCLLNWKPHNWQLWPSTAEWWQQVACPKANKHIHTVAQRQIPCFWFKRHHTSISILKGTASKTSEFTVYIDMADVPHPSLALGHKENDNQILSLVTSLAQMAKVYMMDQPCRWNVHVHIMPCDGFSVFLQIAFLKTEAIVFISCYRDCIIECAQGSQIKVTKVPYFWHSINLVLNFANP